MDCEGDEGNIMGVYMPTSCVAVLKYRVDTANIAWVHHFNIFSYVQNVLCTRWFMYETTVFWIVFAWIETSIPIQNKTRLLLLDTNWNLVVVPAVVREGDRNWQNGKKPNTGGGRCLEMVKLAMPAEWSVLCSNSILYNWDYYSQMLAAAAEGRVEGMCLAHGGST